MNFTTIPLSQLQTDPQRLLSECCDTGRPLLVELPDLRLVTIQSIEPDASDDPLIDNLLQSNAAFRALVEKSKSSPLKKFNGADAPTAQ
jgi:hypothetical protein